MTQPTPTFPAVAGYEKYYGMTLDEVIENIKEYSPDKMDPVKDAFYDTEWVADDFAVNPEKYPEIHIYLLHTMKYGPDVETRAAALVVSSLLTKV